MKRVRETMIRSLLLLTALLVGCEDEPEAPQSDLQRSEGRESERGAGADPAEPAPKGKPAEASAPPQGQEPGPGEAPPAGHDASAWDAIVSEHVTDDGGFRYEALRDDEETLARLESYLQSVAAADPSRWSEDAQLAFYINAYNAITVRQVLDAWPIDSVKEVKGFFDGNKHEVAGEQVTLDGLENGIIRERFDEPRIHFVVNCASAGCPPLADEAYDAENLERMLAEQTRAYLRSTTEVDREAGEVRVSKIFEWFTEDFEPAGGVRAFVAERLPPEQAEVVEDPQTKLGYVEYGWAINARP